MTANARKPTDPALPFLERALKQSLHSPTFLDVKFFAFSRRIYLGDGSVRVDRPQHILAISSVLKKTDYFEKLLSGGFAESSAVRVPIDASFPEDKAPFSDEYDYDSDSDLDDEEVPDGDIDLNKLHSQDNEESPSGPRGTNGSHLSYGSVQCQQIIISDVAYLTWRAFVFYLYFGKVNFLPLKSTEDEDRTAELERAQSDENAVPPCSPKSMYRLAEKYGIVELQTLAFDAIRSRLSARNIVQEVFSRFTSRYERVREVEITFMRSHYSELGGALATVTDRLVQGEFPYAAEVLKTLLDLKNEGNGSQTPSKGSSNTAATVLPSPSRPTRSPYLLPAGRRSYARGNVALPPFRSNYHALFSPPQATPVASTAPPIMTTSSSGGTSSTSSNNASATPMWSTYSFAIDDDDM